LVWIESVYTKEPKTNPIHLKLRFLFWFSIFAFVRCLLFRLVTAVYIGLDWTRTSIPITYSTY